MTAVGAAADRVRVKVAVALTPVGPSVTAGASLIDTVGLPPEGTVPERLYRPMLAYPLYPVVAALPAPTPETNR